jgi:isopentenyl phosphate kinase
MTTVLKLGGSVLTRKNEPETVDRTALDRAADAVAGSADDRLVLVHGGGSFGHHHAERHGVSATDGSRDAAALTDIHGAMRELNRAVVEALQKRGVGALPVEPLSLAYRGRTGDESGDGLHLPAGGVEAMLAEGFLPVLHGDVVVHEGEGGAILSGDDVVVSLARSLGADRVGLCSAVPGVLGADGTVLARIESAADAADALGGSDATDVTGGMARKVRTLLDLDTPAHVFGPAGLGAFLTGGSPGTAVVGTDASDRE